MTTRNLRRLVGALVIAAGAAARVDTRGAPRSIIGAIGRPLRAITSSRSSAISFRFRSPAANVRAPVVDYSKAPPPRKLETPPTSTVVVVGNSMADWLGYGLDETYADQPDTGVVREIRATAGLIRYDPKNEQLDWPAVIKDQLATEKPNAIIVMLGLNDRIADPRWRAGQGRRPDQSREGGAGKSRAKSDTGENRRRAQRRPMPQPHRNPLARTARRRIRFPAAPTTFTPISGRSSTSSASTT